MKEIKKKVVKLPLTDEQKSMVREALGTECCVIDMPIGENQMEVSRAKSNCKGLKLIFTEEQKKLMLQEEPNSELPGYIIVGPNNPSMTEYGIPTYGMPVPLYGMPLPINELNNIKKESK